MGVMGAGGGSAFLTPPHHDHQFIIAFAAEVPRSGTLAARLGSVTSQTGQLFLGPTPRPRSLDPPASRHRLRRSAPGQSSDDTETGLIRESVARASPTLRRSECVLLCYASRQETDGPRFSH